MYYKPIIYISALVYYHCYQLVNAINLTEMPFAITY